MVPFSPHWFQIVVSVISVYTEITDILRFGKRFAEDRLRGAGTYSTGLREGLGARGVSTERRLPDSGTPFSCCICNMKTEYVPNGLGTAVSSPAVCESRASREVIPAEAARSKMGVAGCCVCVEMVRAMPRPVDVKRLGFRSVCPSGCSR